MTTHPTHTPTPWMLNKFGIIQADRNIGIAEVLQTGTSKQALENAAFIVRAVNAFDDMARALAEVCLDEETNQFVLKMSTMKMVRQAIARAEGKS